MTNSNTPNAKLERRVADAAAAALGRQNYVTAIDVLTGIGWLTPSAVDRWRQGRVDYLERVITASLPKISSAMAIFRRWSEREGLRPSETAYVARTRDRRRLQFSKSGAPAIESSYRTHWVSPKLPEAKQQKLVEKQSKPPDLVVILPLKDWTCEECSGSGDLLIMDGAGPLCLRCADLDHLVFLAAGEAALTRRAKKASKLSAVVVKFSRSRKRYERQGILVEETALRHAEEECLADAEIRQRRRERDEEQRAEHDTQFQSAFADEILALFPGCPADRADAISRHAATRGSGRVGRSAAGRALDEQAVTLAVVAAVRHEDTDYDDLLMAGVARQAARERVQSDIETTLHGWRHARTDL